MPRRVALVTGASRGIGRSIAVRLARQGAAVAVNYREQREQAEQVVAAIIREGGQAIALAGDIGSGADCTELAEATRRAFGAIDILINNAGIFRKGGIAEGELTDLHVMSSVNVDGVIRLTRAVAHDMQSRGWGRVINIASVAGIGMATSGTTFYSATKAAVISLTRRFALELGAHGITVNAIAPGFIRTDMAAQSGADFDTLAAKAMVQRVGKPEDIAAAAAFLASEDAGFITAQVLTVDGGRTDYIGHA